MLWRVTGRGWIFNLIPKAGLGMALHPPNPSPIKILFYLIYVYSLRMWFCTWIICDFVRESYVILYVIFEHGFCMWIIYDFVHRKSSSHSRKKLAFSFEPLSIYIYIYTYTWDHVRPNCFRKTKFLHLKFHSKTLWK